MPRSLQKFIQRYRVLSGFVFGAAYLAFSDPSPTALATGMAIALPGVAIRAWAAGYIRKVRILETEGPYAYTRNPLYFGSLIIAAGFAVSSGSWCLGGLTLVYFASIYFPVMNVEAKELKYVFGAEFDDYTRAVPALLPRVSRWKNSARRFDFQLYLRNREYKTAIGLAAAATILAIKAFYI